MKHIIFSITALMFCAKAFGGQGSGGGLGKTPSMELELSLLDFTNTGGTSLPKIEVGSDEFRRARARLSFLDEASLQTDQGIFTAQKFSGAMVDTTKSIEFIPK